MLKKNKIIKIGIVGNPNCGKTTLFNALTGGKQTVGNWPGVTVEQKIGFYSFGNQQVEVYDLPGIYSLNATSLDEQIARDFVLTGKPDFLINIVDASNLERNLYLTAQLLELKLPMIVVLNKVDVVSSQNIKIKTEILSRLLDCPIVSVVARSEKGIKELKETIHTFSQNPRKSLMSFYFADDVELVLKEIEKALTEDLRLLPFSSRWVSLKILEGEKNVYSVNIPEELQQKAQNARQVLERHLGEDLDIILADGRYGFVHSVCRQTVDRSNILRKNITDVIDRVALNRFLGIPLFLIAMYLTFWITINLGGSFIDFFDKFFGAIFVDGFGLWLTSLGAPVFLKMFLADAVGGAIQTIATFIPPIFFMFLCLSILEDSGYMARAAFLMDRVMRWVGLPGKAFVSLMVGFGCNVPAIMSARTLENRRDRILTILINPFMSCGARMPVYAVFAATFFPQEGGLVIFSLYLIGIVLAIFSAFLFKKTILKGEASSFIMELPPYYVPNIKNIFIHTWERLQSFLFRAGQALLIVVVILILFNSIGIDGSIGNENTEKSILTKIGKTITPIFHPMGITQENWPASVGIFTGLFAKEAVIGAMNTIYSQQNILKDKKENFHLGKKVTEAFETIPKNLAKIDLPFYFGKMMSIDRINKESDIDSSTMQQIQRYFDGKVGAFAYLLLILLYMPCVASIAAAYHELNAQWALFMSCYFSALAWLVSTLFYQIMRFSHQPQIATFWIGVASFVFIGFIVVLYKKGPIRNL
ncbi:MAG TPA: Fe(2+) transporter permease subunit FeoB [Candidatus Omnitrophota bacterium]|nr:Fe(2+) transporter permease subunit FeoB [Candidatus Omnitrophota bacterium]